MSTERAEVSRAGGHQDSTPAEAIDACDVVRAVKPMLREYRFDQYKNYPAINPRAWEGYHLERLEDSIKSDEWLFFSLGNPGSRVVLGCRISKWDEEVFGVRMAFIHVLCCEPGSTVGTFGILTRASLKALSAKGVRFVSSRVNGDNLPAIHALESAGFRYYETVIWPVASIADTGLKSMPGVRPMADSDMNRVAEIAGHHSYSRGHYYCDPGFERSRVDKMCVEWVTGSYRKGGLIAVIESDDQVAGYFAFMLDERLSKALGYKYARMRHLALDSSFRGKGLGNRLFKGTLYMMGELGAKYVDSGYSTKNHVSAKLHTLHAFHSVYEEVTLHLWL